MKKVFLAIAFALPVIFVSAQSRQEKIGFGINGGLSSFKLSGSDGFKYKAGFAAGVSATMPIGNQFYIQPEVNFQQQGTKLDGSLFEGTEAAAAVSNSKLKLNYINVPVLVKYKFAPTHLSIYAGPQVGFNISAKNTADVNNVSVSVDAKDEIKTVDFGGVYGLEYYFPVTPLSAIVLNARYQTGFTNIAKGLDAGDPKVKNSGFTFTVGYRF